MAGAIVVGDGAGKLTTSSVTGRAVVPPVGATAAREPGIKSAASNQPGNLWLLALMVIGMGGAFWWLRRKPQAEL